MRSEQLAAQIPTPDRRVRVFVSSTLGELAPERQKARAAITDMRMTPVLFEMGARPHPPRELYRAYLAQSDVFVGIYWQRYGWVAPGETVSGLEDEYALSGDRPKLIYVKAPAPDREPLLSTLLKRVQADDRVSYKPFADPDELGELLADDLAVLLTERFTTRGAHATAGLRPGRLPAPLTPMIGRDADRAALVARFQSGTRLVTVTGPGGIGKTRLALEVASALAGSVFDGAWFVDLASLAQPARVPGAIAEALGVRAPGRRQVLDVLADRMTGGRVLLVLDNLEHLLAAGPDIARLLADVPDLGVLATSRTVLRLRGELEWPLPPLTVPGVDEADPEQVAASPAVSLFVARAAESRPGFVLTPENASAVAEICRRLEGIPLAIELAAARARLLPPSALVARLAHRLDLPGGQVDLPERQRTLRSTLDWSYKLLSPSERTLLARLSIFAGGWTVDAAESVSADDDRARPETDDVLSTLSALVDSSLVTVDDGAAAAPRFRMLGVVRDYAAERLDELGMRDAASDRLVQVVTEVVEEATVGLRSAFRSWAARLDDELDNVRAALRRTIDTDQAETAYRISVQLAYYCWSRSLLAEVRSLLEEVAALPSAARLDAAARSRLLWGRASTSITIGHREGVRPMLDEALRLGEELGDPERIACATIGLSYVADDDEIPRVRTGLEKGAAYFRRSGDLANEAYTLPALGQLMMRSGDLDDVAPVYDRCLHIARQMDNDHLQTLALHQLGFHAVLGGEPARARELFEASVVANTNLLDQEGLSYCLDGLAAVAQMEGQTVAAARLYGAAERLRAVLGIDVWLSLQPFREQRVAALRATLGEEAFEQEREVGTAMRPAAALAYIREISAAVP